MKVTTGELTSYASVTAQISAANTWATTTSLTKNALAHQTLLAAKVMPGPRTNYANATASITAASTMVTTF